LLRDSFKIISIVEAYIIVLYSKLFHKAIRKTLKKIRGNPEIFCLWGNFVGWQAFLAGPNTPATPPGRGARRHSLLNLLTG
jgi:hypothetical protein